MQELLGGIQRPQCCWVLDHDWYLSIPRTELRLIFNGDIIDRRLARFICWLVPLWLTIIQKPCIEECGISEHVCQLWICCWTMLDYVGLGFLMFPWSPRWMHCNCSGTFRHWLPAVYCSIPEVHGRHEGQVPWTRLWDFDVLKMFLRCFLKDFKGKKHWVVFDLLGSQQVLVTLAIWHSIDNFLPVSTCIPLYPLVSTCQVWCPNPTWGNHPKIFQRALLECETRHRKEGALEMQGMQGDFLTCRLHKCGYFTNKV